MSLTQEQQDEIQALRDQSRADPARRIAWAGGDPL